MNVADIKECYKVLTIEMIPEKKVYMKRGSSFIFTKESNKIFISPRSGKKALSIEFQNKDNGSEISKILIKGIPYLACIIESGELLVAKVYIFEKQMEMDLEIGITDDFAIKAKKSIQLENAYQIPESMKSKFVMSFNDSDYTIIGIETKAERESEKIELPEGGYVIVSDNEYLMVKAEKNSTDEIRYIAFSLKKSIKTEFYNFILVKGNVKFDDVTKIGRARSMTLSCMKNMQDNVTSYFKTWDTYLNLEIEKTVNRVKEAGIIHYSGFEFVGGHYKLEIDDHSKFVDFKSNIKNEDSTVLMVYETDVSENLFSCSSFNELNEAINKDSITVTLVDIDDENDSITVSLSYNGIQLFESGYVSFSIRGEASMFERRQKARLNIVTAKNYMPMLGTILEGKYEGVKNSEVKDDIPPITDSVLKEVFKDNPPTATQIEAIRIALNTPDIAIIQGPPGTGKTTVIRAILKRLNEETDSSGGLFAKNLVSAFQHDAVTNAIERIENFGLPAIKIGEKYAEDDASLIGYQVENWIDGMVQKFQNKYSYLLEKRFYIEFSDIYDEYISSNNTYESTLHILKKVNNILNSKELANNTACISVEIIEKLHYYIRKFERMCNEVDESYDSINELVHWLPLSVEAYNDDGENEVRRIISAMKNNDEEYFFKVIERLNKFISEEKTSNVFEEIKKLKIEVLSKLQPKKDIFSKPNVNQEIRVLLNDIKNRLYEQVYESADGEEAILLEYYLSLLNDPLGVKEAILNYSSVSGATNQKSTSKVIMDMKADGKKFYENVLIDEAARSNPLDLLIPLSLARDRIILVGDHRQLPQIVEEDIVDKILNTESVDGNASEVVRTNIENSLFERLFILLKELEVKDKIKRTITLDSQYRMHPKLGKLVSKEFYEIEDSDPEIKSPRPAEQFKHELPGIQNKAYIWMNVPFTAKKAEERDENRSFYRECEVGVIVNHLTKMLQSEAGKKLTFGIITFYKGQEKKFKAQLEEIGIMRKKGKEYELCDEYTKIEGKIGYVERIRVGTVDAFQGMEFDVVYLSMVRSNTIKLGNSNSKKRELMARSKYGFLKIPNRLCVGMSRQKKLLIIVGDSDMVLGQDAKGNVEPLTHFYEMCQGAYERKDFYGDVIQC